MTNCATCRWFVFLALWMGNSLAVAWLAGAEPAAEKSDPALLTLDRIFNSRDLDGVPGMHVDWSGKRGGYLTWEGSKGPAGGRDLVWHDTASDQTEILIPSHRLIPAGEEAPLSVEGLNISADESKVLISTNTKRVWRMRSRGDYWLLDLGSWELRRLGGNAPAATLMHAKFSPDGQRIAYVRENNLYVEDCRTGQITPLTSDGGPRLINGTFDWVYEEELGLRDGFRWSPDGREVLYWQLDITGVREFHLLHNTDGLYAQVQSIPYPKAGEINAACRLGMVSAAGGETRWLPIPGHPREHYLAHASWTRDGKSVIVQQLNRLQNELPVYVVDAKSLALQVLFTERDAAWIDFANVDLTWLADGNHFLWLSERDGWQHVYRVSLQDGGAALLTPGDLDVLSIEGIDEPGGWLYFIASPNNPTQRYLYRAKLDGSHVERVTPADAAGTHSYQLAPNCQTAIHTFSTFASPPQVELIKLPDHQRVRVLAENKSQREAIEKLKRPKSEFFRVDLGEGIQLDAWCLLPPDLDAKKKYPVLFHVYGEPAGQTVLDRWGGKRQLWHWMLAQQGYVVISVDNRGTPAPRGREWRKSVHRKVGIQAPEDQAAAVRAILKQRPYLDPNRVGIWGWSGGGSMTLHAIFRFPDLYQVAISVAPVANQRLYDSIYQERYMGLPNENVDGYRRGSPLTYAHQLKGKLLLVHGTGDDNVHYQGTESLINELITHNKSFSMFAYPSRSHGISERPATTRHLYGLFTEYLHANLPPN